MSPLQKRLSTLLSVLSVLLVVVLAAMAFGWWQMRGSLPQLDGQHVLPGLGAPVQVARDSLGVPTITGVTRADVARATGFLHAQDRFFQMDMLRRSGAGELAEIFGAAALPIDRAHRLHGFRPTAVKVVAALPADQRAILEAYTAGVNAGLAALRKIPWEYLVLRTPPRPWKIEDSILVSYAMWFDLQDSTGGLERNLRAVQSALGLAGLNFFAPRGNSWDAALDGSTYAPAPLPPLRLQAPAEEKTDAFVPRHFPGPIQPEPQMLPGSNCFAVSGAHTASGAALLANDMHLGLSVPPTWYRAVFNWRDSQGSAHRVVGVTLPGTPLMVIGSNGRIAWGFTNSYIDTTDVVVAETDSIAQIAYRTAHGWKDVDDRADPIKVKGRNPVPFVARWTEWGPILAGPADGRYLVLRWNAHNAESTNLDLIGLETATTAAEAVNIAHHIGMPNQNLLVADAGGAIAWTLTGTIPRRVGYDGRLPVSWAYGDRYWDGWLKPGEIPVVFIPGKEPPATLAAPVSATDEALAKEGILWTANQRMVGGTELAKIGDGGYGAGARAGQIRDDLRQLVGSGKKVTPADLLAIQLDDRAVFLGRWQKFLLDVLSDEAVAKKPARGDLREVVRRWNGRADIDSAAYRLVRRYRLKLADRVLAPFFENARDDEPQFSYSRFHYEDALWQLVHDKPVRMLNPVHPSWESLFLTAADDVIADAAKEGVPLRRLTWGARNTLRMQHPFSSFLPGPLARLLNMPAEPLPGDNDMPRVQGPAFGASERMVVSPGHENEGIFHMPGGQCGHPLSPYYRAGHEAWAKGEPTPLLPGPAQHTLVLEP